MTIALIESVQKTSHFFFRLYVEYLFLEKMKHVFGDPFYFEWSTSNVDTLHCLHRIEIRNTNVRLLHEDIDIYHHNERFLHSFHLDKQHLYFRCTMTNSCFYTNRVRTHYTRDPYGIFECNWCILLCNGVYIQAFVLSNLPKYSFHRDLHSNRQYCHQFVLY